MRINYADSIEGKAEKSQLYSLKKEQEGKPLLQLELTDVERKRNRGRGGGNRRQFEIVRKQRQNPPYKVDLVRYIHNRQWRNWGVAVFWGYGYLSKLCFFLSNCKKFSLFI